MLETFYAILQHANATASAIIQVYFVEKNRDRARRQFLAALEASGWKVSSEPFPVPEAPVDSPAHRAAAADRAHAAPRRSTHTRRRK